MKRAIGWSTQVLAVAVLSAAVGVGVAWWGVAGRPDEPTANEHILVPVAARDLSEGTWFSNSDVRELFTYRYFPRHLVPPDVLLDRNELVGKRVTRSLRLSEMVRLTDFEDRLQAENIRIDPPQGTAARLLRIAADAPTSGLALPGYKLIVMARKRSERLGKEVVIPLALDVLVLEAKPADQAAKELLLSVTVTPEQNEILTEAENCGLSLSVGLPQCGGLSRYENDREVFHLWVRTTEELHAALDSE